MRVGATKSAHMKMQGTGVCVRGKKGKRERREHGKKEGVGACVFGEREDKKRGLSALKKMKEGATSEAARRSPAARRAGLAAKRA